MAKTLKRRHKRKYKRTRRKRKGGKICFSKKCRDKRNSRKQMKKDQKVKEDAEEFLYSLAYQACTVNADTTKAEYDECVENIVHSKKNIDVDNILQELEIDIEKLKKEIKKGPPPGMAVRNSAPPRMTLRRPTPPGLSQNFINPIHRQDGAARRMKKRRKTRKNKKSRKRKRKTRR